MFLFLLNPLFAQESLENVPAERVEISRILGDQYLNITLGLGIPLFIHNPDPQNGESPVSTGNLKPGGQGALSWAAFLNNNVSLGLDIAGSFNDDINKGTIFSVPIGIQISYFLRKYPFEIPLQFGIGTNIIRYKELTSFGFMLKSGVSLYWNALQDWSFGINFTYWWLPEIYAENGNIPASNTRFGNFLEITLSVMYNF